MTTRGRSYYETYETLKVAVQDAWRGLYQVDDFRKCLLELKPDCLLEPSPKDTDRKRVEQAQNTPLIVPGMREVQLRHKDIKDIIDLSSSLDLNEIEVWKLLLRAAELSAVESRSREDLFMDLYYARRQNLLVALADLVRMYIEPELFPLDMTQVVAQHMSKMNEEGFVSKLISLLKQLHTSKRAKDVMRHKEHDVEVWMAIKVLRDLVQKHEVTKREMCELVDLLRTVSAEASEAEARPSAHRMDGGLKFNCHMLLLVVIEALQTKSRADTPVGQLEDFARDLHAAAIKDWKGDKMSMMMKAAFKLVLVLTLGQFMEGGNVDEIIYVGLGSSARGAGEDGKANLFVAMQTQLLESPYFLQLGANDKLDLCGILGGFLNDLIQRSADQLVVLRGEDDSGTPNYSAFLRVLSQICKHCPAVVTELLLSTKFEDTAASFDGFLRRELHTSRVNDVSGYVQLLRGLCVDSASAQYVYERILDGSHHLFSWDRIFEHLTQVIEAKLPKQALQLLHNEQQLARRGAYSRAQPRAQPLQNEDDALHKAERYLQLITAVARCTYGKLQLLDMQVMDKLFLLLGCECPPFLKSATVSCLTAFVAHDQNMAHLVWTRLEKANILPHGQRGQQGQQQQQQLGGRFGGKGMLGQYMPHGQLMLAGPMGGGQRQQWGQGGGMGMGQQQQYGHNQGQYGQNGYGNAGMHTGMGMGIGVGMGGRGQDVGAQQGGLVPYGHPNHHQPFGHHGQMQAQDSSGDASSGIMYDMEEVEAKARSYPLTLSFCHLVLALLHSTSYPMSMAPHVWPYVDFVLSQVLLKLNDRQYGDPAEKWSLLEASLAVLCKVVDDLDAGLDSYDVAGNVAPGLEVLMRLCGEDDRLLAKVLETMDQSFYKGGSGDDVQLATAGRAMEGCLLMSLRLLAKASTHEEVAVRDIRQLRPRTKMKELSRLLLERPSEMLVLIARCVGLQQEYTVDGLGFFGPDVSDGTPVGETELAFRAAQVLLRLSNRDARLLCQKLASHRHSVCEAIAKQLRAAPSATEADEEANDTMDMDEQHPSVPLQPVRIVILQILLENLQGVGGDGGSLTHLMLGYDLANVAHSDLCSSTTRDGVLDVLCDLACKPGFASHFPVLAECCFELFYRLANGHLTGRAFISYLDRRDQFFFIGLLDAVPMVANPKHAATSLLQRAWLLKSVALKMHVTSRRGHMGSNDDLEQSLARLGFAMGPDSRHLQQRQHMMMLKLLDSLHVDVGQSREIPRQIVVNGKPIDLEPCRIYAPDGESFQWDDVALERMFTLANSPDAADIGARARLCNEEMRLLVAANQAFLGWKQTVEVSLHSCYDPRRTPERYEAVLFELLTGVLHKLKLAPSVRVWLCLSEHLSAVALTIVSKLRQQIEVTRGQQATQYRAVLELTVEAILANRHSKETRAALYAVFFNYMQYTAELLRRLGAHSVEVARTQDLSAEQRSLELRNWAFLRQPHIADPLLQSVCRDACEPSNLRALAFVMLSALLSDDRREIWLRKLRELGCMELLLRDLRQRDAFLHTAVVSPQMRHYDQILTYEPLLALLVKMATSAHGTQLLLEHHAVEMLTELQCLHKLPRGLESGAGARSAERAGLSVPTPVERFYQLYIPALELLTGLMTTAPRHVPLHRCALAFMTAHRQAVEAILKNERHDHLPSLQALSLTLSALRALEEGPLMTNSPQLDCREAIEGLASSELLSEQLQARCVKDRMEHAENEREQDDTRLQTAADVSDEVLRGLIGILTSRAIYDPAYSDAASKPVAFHSRRADAPARTGARDTRSQAEQQASKAAIRKPVFQPVFRPDAPVSLGVLRGFVERTAKSASSLVKSVVDQHHRLGAQQPQHDQHVPGFVGQQTTGQRTPHPQRVARLQRSIRALQLHVSMLESGLLLLFYHIEYYLSDAYPGKLNGHFVKECSDTLRIGTSLLELQRLMEEAGSQAPLGSVVSLHASQFNGKLSQSTALTVAAKPNSFIVLLDARLFGGFEGYGSGGRGFLFVRTLLRRLQSLVERKQRDDNPRYLQHISRA